MCEEIETIEDIDRLLSEGRLTTDMVISIIGDKNESGFLYIGGRTPTWKNCCLNVFGFRSRKDNRIYSLEQDIYERIKNRLETKQNKYNVTPQKDDIKTEDVKIEDIKTKKIRSQMVHIFQFEN